MIVKIDTDFIQKHNLTPNQFLILQLMHEKKTMSTIKNTLNSIGIDVEEELDELASRGFVNKGTRTYRLTDDYLEIVDVKNSFEELLNIFPKSVIRVDGKTDYLRTDQSRSKAKYLRLIRRRRDIHEHIISCLKYEVQERTKTGTLGWMKRLPNWLNSEGWLEWEQKMKDGMPSLIEDAENDMPYGTKLL